MKNIFRFILAVNLLNGTMRFFLCVCISFVFFACSQNASSNTAESYGDNSFYYLALRSLSSGDEKEAHRLFTLGSQKGSGYIARKCFEELTLLGGVQQRLVASKNLVEKYGDEDAILVACRQYDASGEYTKIIVAAEKINLSTCNGELAKIYLTALAKIESKKFLDEAYRCFSSRPINEYLYALYREVLSDEGEIENILNESNLSLQNTKSEKIDAKISAQKKIINFRIDVYLKNYKAAYEKLNEILSLASTQTSKGSENEGLTLTAQLVSDMGKTCLYGSSNNARNAARFENLSRGSSDNEIIFYSSFYAGRLYEKAGSSFENVSSHFLKSMDFAPDEEKHDNALWYLLNSAMRSSTDILIQSLQKYCKTWKDPSYFDDIFELLVSRLLAQERWNDFGLIYKTVDSYASDEVVSQYAYIYARLLQEELASANNKNRTIEDAFTRALSSGTNVYYKALAISCLNLDYDESVRKMSETKINQNFKKNEEAERLLLGYAVFGIPEKIYPEWRNLVYEKKIDISLDCACALADFLNHVSNKTDDYYMQALRIMAKTANFCETNLTEKAIQLLYPRNYASEVEEACKKFDVQQDLMFGLIRSESFFDSDVVSSAGAIGLTQLMNFTAADVASRLRKKDYSLRDPTTNIEFGTYYLSSLIKRSDDSALSALFSYNAGHSRVRRWIRSSKLELNAAKSFSYDLFLETIPFAETREYGRKVVGAACMYGISHFGKSVQQIIAEIM